MATIRQAIAHHPLSWLFLNTPLTAPLAFDSCDSSSQIGERASLDFKTCRESTRRNIAPSCHTTLDQTTGRPDDQTTHNEIIYIEEGNINFLKTEFGSSVYLTGEAKEKVLEKLGTYFVELKADPNKFNPLLQNVREAHSREVDFRNKAFKIFKRELLFKQLALDEYAKNLEQDVANETKKIEKEVDKVRREFSKKVADSYLENTRLTAEVETLTRTNFKQATLIADFNNRPKESQASDESKTFLTEYETVKTNLEKAKSEIIGQNDCINDLRDSLSQLKEDTEDKIKQLNHSYNLLDNAHEALKNASKLTEDDVTTLTNKNQELSQKLDTLQIEANSKEASIKLLKTTKRDLSNKISDLEQELKAKDLYIQKHLKSTLVADTQTHSKPTQTTNIITMTLGNSNEDAPITKSHLRELYSQDERKSIPIFKGKRGEQLVNNWLKDAERVAQSAGWEKKDKIKYFSDRLRGDAADWHSDYMERAQDEEDYDAWEKALINRFLTETELENLRKQLNELRQTPDQSTQTFVSRINQLYDIIHGKEITLGDKATNEAKALAISLSQMRGEAKQKILLKGLLPKILKIVWSRMDVDSAYEDVCENAYAAETLVNRMEQNEDKSLKATIAGISAHDNEQDIEILRQKTKIVHLEKQLAGLTIGKNAPQENNEIDFPSIAVADAFNRHRSPSGDRRRKSKISQAPYTYNQASERYAYEENA
ncbi:myosin-11-like [Daphnia pulicaria]|uniref:myosin-11-like n=1 Tax=Daphnia pulicaria TaxID=35523 RepID=UPI001EEB80A6|nr:myosin-11-like [Daphnia pulicaria]